MLELALLIGALTLAGCAVHQDALPTLNKVDWTPPSTTLDPAYVKQAQALLGNGLGDPRGGRFGKLKIRWGDGAWSGKSSGVDVLGWLLKDGKHAVLLDGVEHPVEPGFEPVDLDEALAGPSSRGQVRIGPLRGETGVTPAVLLVVGRPDLAEKVATILNGASEFPAYQLNQDLFLSANLESAQCLIDRRDAEGIRWAEMVYRVLKVREETGVVSRHPETAPQFTKPLSYGEKLYRDMVRRSQNAKQEPVDLPSLSKLEKSQRIAALVDALDTVSARQKSQPGGVNLTQDPVSSALIAEGEDAVPALIGVIDHDDRLTRSVSFFRDFAPYRNIMSVRAAAWSILETIWPDSSRWKMDSPTDSAKALRTAWSTEAKLSQEGRWVKVLKDDAATPGNWLQAAKALTAHTKGVDGPSDREDVYRIMAKRAISIGSTRVGNSNDIFSTASSLEMAHCLARWDAPLAKDDLETLCHLALRRVSEWDKYPMYITQSLIAPFGMVACDRIRLGDEAAIGEYGKILGYLDDTSFVNPDCFRPLWTFPEDVDVQKVAESVFKGISAGLASSDTKLAGKKIYFFIKPMRQSRLLQVSAYRRALARGLQNSTPMGEAWVEQPNLRFTSVDGGQGGLPFARGAKLPDTEGHVKFSVGDLIAQQLQLYLGVPNFLVIWPEDKRASARRQIAEWLEAEDRDWKAVTEGSAMGPLDP